MKLKVWMDDDDYIVIIKDILARGACWSNIRKYENNTRIPIIIIIKKFTTLIIYEININRDKVRKTDKLGD